MGQKRYTFEAIPDPDYTSGAVDCKSLEFCDYQIWKWLSTRFLYCTWRIQIRTADPSNPKGGMRVHVYGSDNKMQGV
jgi:hypothetical protein